MNLKIENFSILKSANVKLNGLTVIAGTNDTGKSTVGKLLFSIVKAVSRYEQDLIGSKEKNIFRSIENLYFNIRRTEDIPDFEELKKVFYPPHFLEQIRPFIENSQISLFPSNEMIDDIFNQKEAVLLRIDKSEQFITKLRKIKDELIKDENRTETIRRAFQKSLNSEFFGEVSPKGQSPLTKISYSEGENTVLTVAINDNKITSFDLIDVLPFKDVTYIETPLLLQMYELIESAGTLFDLDEGAKRPAYMRPTISFHLKDLISKVKTAAYNIDSSSETHSQISAVINGEYKFDRGERNFIFTKRIGNESFKIKALNTASGIKSFGILQLLLQSNTINDRSMLIIDEPENHLHPIWQVEYARVIVELAKADIPVLLSSHSPYMIQAINHFSAQAEINTKVNYYLSEIDEKDGSSNIDNVTDDLNRIFIKLAEPLNSLIW